MKLERRKDDLQSMFEKYGKIGDVYIPRNVHDGGNRGFGFVRFFNEDDAREALKEDGNTLRDASIKVSMADARPPRRE